MDPGPRAGALARDDRKKTRATSSTTAQNLFRAACLQMASGGGIAGFCNALAQDDTHSGHPREGGDPVTPVCPHRTVGITGSRLALAVARLAGMTSGVCFRDRSHTGHPRARQHAQHCDHPAHAPVIPARASRHTRHPREGGDPVTPVCPHRTVGITGSRLALAVARLAGMTSGVCFRSRYPFPLNAPLIGFQKKPFGVLGQHSKTWSDLKSACLPPTPRPAAE